MMVAAGIFHELYTNYLYLYSMFSWAGPFWNFTLIHVAKGYWANIKPCETWKGFYNLKTKGARGICNVPAPLKTKIKNSSKHRNVAFLNDCIEMLIMNQKNIFKDIVPGSNKISLST